MTPPAGVLHLVNTTKRRGAEVFAIDLSAALSADGLTSHVVALTTDGPSDHALDLDALGDKPMAPGTLRRMRRVARHVSVVVAHGARTLDACAVGLVGTGTPFIYRSIGDPAAWSARGLRRWRTAALLRRAPAVAVYWEGAARTLTRLHHVPPDRVWVIPKGVPADDYPLADTGRRVSARARLGLPAEAPVLVTIGALDAEKRVDLAIDTLVELPDAHLLVAGDGPERPRLEARAARVAPGRVHFAGVLPGIAEAVAAADVALLTSRTEGMPGVLIEAGLSGVPCVATEVGGVPEIVLDGVTGILVDPDAARADGGPRRLADGVRHALAEGREMGAAGRRHCLSHFTMDVVARRWAKLLRRIAAGYAERG